MIFAFVMTFVITSIAAFAQGQVAYDSIPSPLPGNLASLGYEATASDEFGDRVVFAANTGRRLFSVTQTMSSWGCESGSWYAGDCVSTPGSTFSHPITLNIYNVGPGGSVGSLIYSATQSFNIPYRPSADYVNCSDGTWFEGSDCFNGLATNITFNIPAVVNLPNEVIYGIAYNTTHYGAAPIGESALCYAESGGCGYDSLNVALEGVTTVGSNYDPNDAYWDTSYAPFYCDGGTGGVDVFRRDAPSIGCNWTGYQPSVRFSVTNVPTNANQCKNNGWQSRTRADGTFFKNQGDCIQYVNTGK